jgi:CRISPR-associated protein Cmr6
MSKQDKFQPKPMVFKSFAELPGAAGSPATPGTTPSPPAPILSTRDSRTSAIGGRSQPPSGPILPLPKDVAAAARKGWKTAHPALAFQKFIEWPSTWEFSGEKKREFLYRFVEAFADHPGRLLFKEFMKRREAFLKQLRDEEGYCVPDPARLSTQWRLVSGLGIPHPFETGFVFDHTYGVPYLPGSSVKGAARTWAEEMRNDGDRRWGCAPDDETVLDTVFGPEQSEERKGKFTPAQGAVIFLDAYPSTWPKLEVDILNPHYKEYYERKVDANRNPIPPVDYLSPTPIYFLTVAPDQAFEFAVAVKASLEKETLKAAGVHNGECLVTKALEAIQGAARDLGFGGKTAVGYGYFRP